MFDFLPQSFMIALMGTLVPGVLTRRKLQAGVVAALPGTTRLPRNLVVRALSLAVASAALVVAVTFATQQESLAFAVALTLKVAYGALLAALITPLGLRAALTCS